MVNSILPRMWLIEDQRCTLKHCTSWNMPNAVLESCGDPKPHPEVCKPSFCKVTDTTEQLWFHSLLFRDMVRGGRQAGEGDSSRVIQFALLRPRPLPESSKGSLRSQGLHTHGSHLPPQTTETLLFQNLPLSEKKGTQACEESL